MITTNTIGFLWVHGELPPLAHATLRSFAANGHECALYSYDNPAVPKGCRLLDAREILPEEEIWHGRNGSLACFADFFRWKLMYEKGCFWADIDIFCLKLMPAFAPGSVLYKSSDTSECPFQGFYRLPQGHPALKQGIDWISSVSLKERSKFRYTAVMDHLCRYFKDS
ncbi:MAG: hypothetical protein LBV12_10945, partial [Puniceicoccales bacterium]|nr:hypothetical protein [Puniceicoccales bacterium]